MGTYIIRPTQLISGGSKYFDYNVSNSLHGGDWAQNFGAGVLPISTIVNIMNQTADTYFFAAVSGSGINPPDSIAEALRFSFTGSSFYLDGSLVPIDFSGLPSGFTAITASVKVDPSINIRTDAGCSAQYKLQQDIFTSGTANTPSFDYSIVPSILDIWSNGCGLRADTSSGAAGNIGAVQDIFNLRVEGTYNLLSVWYYNPVTNQYQYAGSNPGAPWVPQAPTLALYRVTPQEGTTAGG